MNYLYLALGLAVLFGGGFILFDLFYLKKRRQMNGLNVRILLYEQIGDDKVFKGSFKGVERYDEKLGQYIWISKLKKAIDVPANLDYFYDKELDKALNVCKFSDDDYRVMARLRNQEFFRLEKFMRPKLDVKGNPLVEVVDGEDKPVLEEVEEFVPYFEPLGISQEGREASRFNRVFVKRMQEKRNEKAGFWDKYGQIVSIAFVGLILLVSFVYMTNSFKDINEKNAEVWGEKLSEAIDAQSNPSWVEGLVESLNRRNVEGASPDS